MGRQPRAGATREHWLPGAVVGEGRLGASSGPSQLIYSGQPRLFQIYRVNVHVLL